VPRSLRNALGRRIALSAGPRRELRAALERLEALDASAAPSAAPSADSDAPVTDEAERRSLIEAIEAGELPLGARLPGERARRVAHSVSLTESIDPETVRRIGAALVKRAHTRDLRKDQERRAAESRLAAEQKQRDRDHIAWRERLRAQRPDLADRLEAAEALHGQPRKRALYRVRRAIEAASAAFPAWAAKTAKERAGILRRWGLKLAEKQGPSSKKWFDMGDEVQAIMLRDKNIHPNVDFPCGMTYFIMGIPVPQYTPIFVAARITGWAAHISEQHADNRLIRPLSIYTGPALKKSSETTMRRAP
jgi:hypothetical protein